MIERGKDWGLPATGPADAGVSGGDADLALAVAAHPGGLLRFSPSPASDVGRALGLGPDRDPDAASALAVPMDALRADPGGLACNMIVVGVPPDRLHVLSRPVRVAVTVDGRSVFEGSATTVVVATGQFLRGRDVVPRGHPGDGRAEIQVYRVGARERRALRARLATGTHVPHPAITQAAGTRVEVVGARATRVELDGRPQPPVERLTVEVVANAYRLLL